MLFILAVALSASCCCVGAESNSVDRSMVTGSALEASYPVAYTTPGVTISLVSELSQYGTQAL